MSLRNYVIYSLKNIKHKKLSFHKKFGYTFREGLLFVDCIYPTHNITTFKYMYTHKISLNYNL